MQGSLLDDKTWEGMLAEYFREFERSPIGCGIGERAYRCLLWSAMTAWVEQCPNASIPLLQDQLRFVKSLFPITPAMRAKMLKIPGPQQGAEDAFYDYVFGLYIASEAGILNAVLGLSDLIQHARRQSAMATFGELFGKASSGILNTTLAMGLQRERSSGRAFHLNCRHPKNDEVKSCGAQGLSSVKIESLILNALTFSVKEWVLSYGKQEHRPLFAYLDAAMGETCRIIKQGREDVQKVETATQNSLLTDQADAPRQPPKTWSDVVSGNGSDRVDKR